VIIDFSLLHNIQHSSGSTAFQWVPGIFFSRQSRWNVKKTTHIHAKVKNKASHLSAPPTCLDSTNRNNFTFYCYMFRNTYLERLYVRAAVLLKFQVFWYVMPYCWS